MKWWTQWPLFFFIISGALKELGRYGCCQLPGGGGLKEENPGCCLRRTLPQTTYHRLRDIVLRSKIHHNPGRYIWWNRVENPLYAANSGSADVHSRRSCASIFCSSVWILSSLSHLVAFPRDPSIFGHPALLRVCHILKSALIQHNLIRPWVESYCYYCSIAKHV